MKSLSTALRVLTAFTSGRPDWGVGELAEHCGVTKGQVSKILAVYRQFGFLKRRPATRRYSVDLQSFVIGSQCLIHDPMVRHALPIMRQLTETSGHSVRLSVRNNDQLIYLLVTVGPHLLESGWRAGSALPWHTTSAGRIMLAYMQATERDRILNSLERAHPPALTGAGRQALERDLEQARADGYSVASNQATQGLGAISAPVLDDKQQVAGALAIAFPADLYGPGEELSLVPALNDAARALSLRNGAQIYSIRSPAGLRPSERTPAARRRSRPAALMEERRK